MWLNQLRLGPLLILSIALLFSVKVHGVYRGISVRAGVATAQAEQAGEKAAEKSGEMHKPPEAPAPAPMVPAAPPSAGEIDVLQALAARRDSLDQRALELDTREKLLNAAEERVASKITELKKIEGSIKVLIEQQDAAKEAELQNLVKVYGTMKPKEAAPIFDKLDMPVLLSVIQRMPAAKIAPILAVMDPKRANELTVQLATRKVLPDRPPEGLGDGGPGGSRAIPGAAPQAPADASRSKDQAPLRPPGLLQPVGQGNQQRQGG